MVDKSRNALMAAARSLRSTVLQALPADHETAREQARVVAAMLEFAAGHHGHEYFRKVRQLEIYDDMARELLAVMGPADLHHPGPARTLDALIGAERCALAVSSRDFTSVDLALDEFTSAISRLVQIIHADERLERTHTDRIVVTHSARLIEVDRAWFVDQGFDPSPEELRPLTAVLQQSPSPVDHRQAAPEQGVTS